MPLPQVVDGLAASGESRAWSDAVLVVPARPSFCRCHQRKSQRPMPQAAATAAAAGSMRGGAGGPSGRVGEHMQLRSQVADRKFVKRGQGLTQGNKRGEDTAHCALEGGAALPRPACRRCCCGQGGWLRPEEQEEEQRRCSAPVSSGWHAAIGRAARGQVCSGGLGGGSPYGGAAPPPLFSTALLTTSCSGPPQGQAL